LHDIDHYFLDRYDVYSQRNHELPMILTTIWVRTKHDEEITIFLLWLLPWEEASMLRNHELPMVLNSTLTDSYRPIFGWNHELPKIPIRICHRTKRSNDITPTSIGSYSVSPSLLTDKILVQQQPMDEYDIYSRMEPRASNGCQLRIRIRGGCQSTGKLYGRPLRRVQDFRGFTIIMICWMEHGKGGCRRR
jgi:hypothetical protein